ncbi:hypothetical protein TSUD_332610 [Trifolium subterraneum]|uniref:Ataxin-10 domain-containing protein n=1 Tax=Trifolium subterraneum TaxID=3900 RepID=A0A2Z6MFJ5_TRISU|nr:hypothetical protein TSUD_332610 [Trifolium subterraneum]
MGGSDDAPFLKNPISEETLKLLFHVSNSNSLQNSLEILIQTSKSNSGRSNLASKTILPSILTILQSQTSPCNLLWTFLSSFGEDWIKLLLSRICLEESQLPVLFSKLQFRDILDCEDTKSRDDQFSSEQQAVKSKSGLPSGITAVDVLGYSLNMSRDICAHDSRKGNEEDANDIVNVLLSYGLIELLLTLLGDLEPPAIIRKGIKQSDNQDGGSCSSKPCPYKGFRRDIVALIGNCVYRRKHVQDEIRSRSGILLLLQQCVTDEDNPYLREWGIRSVRNILEGNEENQKVVAELQLQGSADVPEISALGLRVDIDPKTRRAELVNVP